MARLWNLTKQHENGLEVAVDDMGPADAATGEHENGLEVAVDDVGPADATGEAPSALTPLASDALPDIEAWEQDWAGVKWYPGCYTGDDDLHALRLGVVTDHEAWRLYGVELQGMVEDIVSEASLVYELQMNLRLEIGDLQIYQAPGSSSHPRWASASCVAGDEVRQKFNSFSEW